MDNLTMKLLEDTGRGGGHRYYWYLRGHQSSWWTGAPPDHRATCDIYFGVHPTSAAGGPNTRSTNATVSAVGCVYSEFDDKDYEGKMTAREVVEHCLKPRPSVAVASGGGMHCYWIFAQPVIVTDENREDMRLLQRRWVAATGGDPAAADLARILRLPGTFNSKYDPPRRVEFLWYEEPYRLKDIEEFVKLNCPPEDMQPMPAPTMVVHQPALPMGARPMDVERAIVYAECALEDELDKLARTPEGARNKQLNISAVKLAGYVASSLLSRRVVLSGLYATGLAIGLAEREVRATIRSGYTKGLQRPRSVPGD